MSFKPLSSSLRLLRIAAPAARPVQTRCLHESRRAIPRSIPPPIPIVPDVDAFLRIIGRDLSQYSSKFPSWEALFTLTSEQLKEIGIEPARTRRYLLQWLERYRRGLYGPGGDFKYVEDGKASLAVEHDIVKDSKRVVNIPSGKLLHETSPEDRVRVQNYWVKGANVVRGPFALPVGSSHSRVEIQEGMWEHRRGKKVDGGERRRAEVRFKRGVAERKAAREAENYGSR